MGGLLDTRLGHHSFTPKRPSGSLAGESMSGTAAVDPAEVGFGAP
jgi:hypothetical protein